MNIFAIGRPKSQSPNVGWWWYFLFANPDKGQPTIVTQKGLQLSFGNGHLAKLSYLLSMISAVSKTNSSTNREVCCPHTKQRSKLHCFNAVKRGATITLLWCEPILSLSTNVWSKAYRSRCKFLHGFLIWIGIIELLLSESAEHVILIFLPFRLYGRPQERTHWMDLGLKYP